MATSKTPIGDTKQDGKDPQVDNTSTPSAANKEHSQVEDLEVNSSENTETVAKDSMVIGFLKQLWRSFKFYTRIIIYIPLLILVLLALILGTSIGSNIGITIASQLIPNLELHYQSGTINHDLKLDYASWEMDGISVEINDLAIEWLPRCFINKQLCVDSLSASKVAVDIQTALLSDTTASTLVDSQLLDPELITSAQSNTTEQNLSTAENAAKRAEAAALAARRPKTRCRLGPTACGPFASKLWQKRHHMKSCCA